MDGSARLQRRIGKKLATFLMAAVVALAALAWNAFIGGDDETPTRGDERSGQVAEQQDAEQQDTKEQDAGQHETGQDDAGQQGQVDPATGLAWIDVDQLPAEARETLELIHDDGPFPHDRDGITFGNREGILPDRPRGTYREYTVETPGLDHRGARRIVTGEADEFFWTEDHYESFERIRR